MTFGVINTYFKNFLIMKKIWIKPELQYMSLNNGGPGVSDAGIFSYSS